MFGSKTHVSHSKKVAVAALILAGVFLFVVPNRFGNQQPQRGKLTNSLSHAKQIGTACQIYATDHHGSFPKDLNELIPDYLPDRGIFSSPFAPNPGQLDYEYFGAGGADTDPPAKILLRDHYTTADGRRSVVRVDFSAKVERQ